MYNDVTERPLPPTLEQIIADGWTFPTDYPIVNNTNSPDADRTLRAVIEYSIKNYYLTHRICTFNTTTFNQRFTTYLYNKMAQHQYWIDEYLKLIDDNQFFYNEEWNDGGTHTIESNEREASSEAASTSKTSDTPQNSIADISSYLSEAEQSSSTDSGNENALRDNTYTTDLHIKKSTLGDITVQFNNFANFPNFIDQIIDAVSPAFMLYYGEEDIDYGA